MLKKNQINIIKEAFIGYFGEERVDISSLEGSYPSVIVYFPTVTITNEYNEHHTIYEVYVKVIINSSNGCFYDLELTRTAYTKREYKMNYRHSHCPRSSIRENPGFIHCCLGSGPLFVLAQASNFSDLYWDSVCFEVDRYVATESVKGVPYFRMSGLKGQANPINLYQFFRKLTIVNPPNCNTLPSEITTLICLNKYNHYFTYDYEQKGFRFCGDIVSFYYELSNDIMLKAKSHNLLEGLIEANILRYYTITSRNMICYQDILNDGNVNNNELRALTFKGEDKYVKVIEEKEQDKIISYLLLEPWIFLNIMSKLIPAVNKYLKFILYDR